MVERVNNQPQRSYIAVEGPIGVGKTTLCARLAASLRAEQLLEQPEENPFLQRFYEQPDVYALSVQLCFLLQRARQIDSLRQADLFTGTTIADFMFEKDRIFAGLNLAGHEWDLYEDIFRRLAWQAPTPDCVIYLHAPVDVLMQRVRQRNRPEEATITAAYLEDVLIAYTRHFEVQQTGRLITVDAAALDLVNEPKDYKRLLDALSSVMQADHEVIHLS